MPYGYELILDLHNCDVATFTKKSLIGYFEKLCKAIDMEREALHFLSGKEDSPGISAVQFIITSSITVHTLDLLAAAHVNIFSCKKFDARAAEDITVEWFKATTFNEHFVERE